jgi:Fic family protein
MNYIVLVIVAVAGIALGMYIARRKANTGFIAKQMEQKAENKQKILAAVQEQGPTSPRLRRARKIQNNDVEKLAGVSNATAERYLDELEKEGAITQHGTIGQNVFYTPK